MTGNLGSRESDDQTRLPGDNTRRPSFGPPSGYDQAQSGYVQPPAAYVQAPSGYVQGPAEGIRSIPTDLDHPSSGGRAAPIYEQAAHQDEGIPLYERLVADRERVLGEDNPVTLIARGDLAFAYRKAGRLTEAIGLLESALTDSLQSLGESHPVSLACRNNLAAGYQSAGRLAEAISLFERTVAECEQVLGESAVGTLVCRSNLASAYRQAGRLDEAISLLEDTVAKYQRYLGRDNPGHAGAGGYPVGQGHPWSAAQVGPDRYGIPDAAAFGIGAGYRSSSFGEASGADTAVSGRSPRSELSRRLQRRAPGGPAAAAAGPPGDGLPAAQRPASSPDERRERLAGFRRGSREGRAAAEQQRRARVAGGTKSEPALMASPGHEDGRPAAPPADDPLTGPSFPATFKSASRPYSQPPHSLSPAGVVVAASRAAAVGPAPMERFLVAQLPARVPRAAEVSLVVRVSAGSPKVPSAASVGMPNLEVGEEGARVTVVVQAPRQLVPLGELEQVIWVPPTENSQPVRFPFRAHGLGLQRVLVTAWAGGTFLAELALEVSVEADASYVDAPPRTAPVGSVQAEPGEVTLQVRFDGERYTFQLLSQQYLFEPVLAESVTAQPGVAVERMVSTLRDMAVGGRAGGYSPSNARRWMERAGVGLWNGMVPELIREQFWQLQGSISAFSVAVGRDVVPWELLYPLAPGRDEGFLVRQFPVMRRVYGQQRSRVVAIGGAQYVVPAGSPFNAMDEVTKIRRVFGLPDSEALPIGELDLLLALIESGQAGLLHFACHNTFAADATGSAIAMGGGSFAPLLLNKAVTLNTLASRHPLVFINACRSAGLVPQYTHMLGWAEQFMAAGAGAFVGTLWAVRSESASAFAETFYGDLAAGRSLGQACMSARIASVLDEGDPTWLAYTVYGDPAAHAVSA
jgi:tetratricopeptide (TPR) repeat protein